MTPYTYGFAITCIVGLALFWALMACCTAAARLDRIQKRNRMDRDV